MAVWVRFIKLIPNVVCKVFIDDAYIWAHIDHIQNLRHAFDATELWNQLIGQKLNAAKSTLWATSSSARKIAKKIFPLIPVACEFDALGTKIYTSTKDAKMLSCLVRKKWLRLELISETLVPFLCHEKLKLSLLHQKVIPQCTYAADISDIPKKVLSDLQTDIATVLWQNRPHWRSKMLVFCFLSQPCLVEPRIARAYTAVRNFWRFVHHDPTILAKLQNVFSRCIQHKQSLLYHVSSALEVFHLRLFPSMQVGIAQQRFEILDVTPRDLRPFLCTMGRQACYEASGAKARKDVAKPVGLLDYHLSTAFYHKYKPPRNSKVSLCPHYESQLVGCTITNDRRAAVGFTDDPSCRFCGFSKESLRHIVLECSEAPHELRRAPSHDLGPNFSLFGITEHPVALCNFRMCWQTLSIDETLGFDAAKNRRPLWTDGSVFFQNHFWITTGACAIVDSDLNTVFVGRVDHIHLTSYATELFAIVKAVALSQGPVCITTDSLTVVQLFHDMCKNQAIGREWSHSQWWIVLFRLWAARSLLCANPIELKWMRAHTCDDLPIEAISDAVAEQVGFRREDIICNRIADKLASECAASLLPIDPKLFALLHHEAFVRQIALARLNQTIGDIVPLKPQYETIAELEHDDEAEVFRRRFSTWLWDSVRADFEWVPSSSDSISAKLMTKFSVADAHTLINFLQGLSWRVSAELSTSYVEIALLFVRCKSPLEKIQPDIATFVDILKVVLWCFPVRNRLSSLVFTMQHGHTSAGMRCLRAR